MVIGGEPAARRFSRAFSCSASTEPPMVIGGESHAPALEGGARAASTEPPMVIGGESSGAN